MVSPHIELASTVPECNLRSEAKMSFFSCSLFFAAVRGGVYLSLVGLREWLLCWFFVLQSICVHGIFFLLVLIFFDGLRSRIN